jgi:hypothetical protein
LHNPSRFEAFADRMAEAMEANARALDAELDELLAEQLAKARADLVAFAGAAL